MNTSSTTTFSSSSSSVSQSSSSQRKKGDDTEVRWMESDTSYPHENAASLAARLSIECLQCFASRVGPTSHRSQIMGCPQTSGATQNGMGYPRSQQSQAGYWYVLLFSTNKIILVIVFVYNSVYPDKVNAHVFRLLAESLRSEFERFRNPIQGRSYGMNSVCFIMMVF